MAQYKVPQDVEAEDRLLGPFTFRQFIYLMIGAACIAATWGAAQIFIPLVIIPIPLAVFFLVLALPLKKDQPMETYLAAIVSYHVKPNKRFWVAGQRESTILITAPKKTEKSRTRDITEDEASHRLSFLANLVDTEGASIRGNPTSVKEEYLAEANEANDIMDANHEVIDRMIAQEQQERHEELVSQMRTAMQRTDAMAPQMQQSAQPVQSQQSVQMNEAQFAQQMNNLANNGDFSVQTIAAEANRLQQQTQQMQYRQAPQMGQQPIQSGYQTMNMQNEGNY